MKVRLFFVLTGLLVALLAAQTIPPDPVANLEAKFQHITSNANANPPDQTPTELTEQEINAYFAASKVKLPNGVKSISFSSEPGIISGTARVDFDLVREGRSSYNPLLSVFNGEHNVGVIAHAYGAGGKGYVHVDKVTLDEVEIPDFALRMFVEKYVTRKYPNIGIDSHFRLRNRIDTASIGSHMVAITQK